MSRAARGRGGAPPAPPVGAPAAATGGPATASPPEPCAHAVPGGLLLAVRLQPRASRNALLGEQAGALRIALTAPPVEGQANRELLQFLAKRLALAAGRLELRQGAHGRDKLIFVPGLALAELRVRLGLDA